MSAIRTGLWSNRDFVKLWIGQSISQFGAQITLLALPLTAVQAVQASSFQMGLLRALEYLPFLLFGMLSGVLADRMRRKNIMIVSDLVRTVFLLAIPLAAFYECLTIEILYVSAFLVGAASVFFDVAYWSYVPSLVSHDELVEGNSKLTLSQSSAEALGPGAAGVLIGLFTAPLTILLNAVSFLVSALSLVAIKHTEPPAQPQAAGQSLWQDLTLGLVFVLRESVLRALLLRATVWNFIYNFGMPVFLLYCTTTLQLQPAFIGLMFTCMGLGFVAGAMLMETGLSRLGVGELICLSMLCAALAACGLCIQLEGLAPQKAVLMVSLFVIGTANSVYNINNVSLRQALTPPALLGRMTAAMRLVSWGIMPFGALLGGFCGDRFGLQPTLLLMSATAVIAALGGLGFGPVKSIAQLPAPASAACS
ncbi:MAG: MFS transporter [Acidobacteriales bacterium]|nr:MFS transporter [Terriglobales bacterium]